MAVRNAGTIRVRRALISVSDKTGLVEFATDLTQMEAEILSTGGTARALRDAGIGVREVSEVTGFPEMLGGRVKTLHPKIHGGILARRDHDEHLRQLRENGIDPIDLVVVNLYPFEATISRPDCSMAEAVENIDIGGPCLIRAAAKNHEGVVVVVDPEDYALIVEELTRQGGVSQATAYRLAQKAFGRTAQYDATIAEYLRSQTV